MNVERPRARSSEAPTLNRRSTTPMRARLEDVGLIWARSQSARSGAGRWTFHPCSTGYQPDRTGAASLAGDKLQSFATKMTPSRARPVRPRKPTGFDLEIRFRRCPGGTSSPPQPEARAIATLTRAPGTVAKGLRRIDHFSVSCARIRSSISIALPAAFAMRLSSSDTRAPNALHRHGLAMDEPGAGLSVDVTHAGDWLSLRYSTQAPDCAGSSGTGCRFPLRGAPAFRR